MKKFEAAIEELGAGLAKARTTKKYGKIIERIGRLKEKYFVGNYFDMKSARETGSPTPSPARGTQKGQLNQSI